MAKNDDDKPVVDDSNVSRNLVDTPDSESQGPQMFTPEQLPDPNVARAAGLTPQAIPATQIIDGEDAYSHPRGPEPGEQVRAEQRAAIVERVVENNDVPSLPDVTPRALATTATEPEATSAVGRALQKREDDAAKDDSETDDLGRGIDPEGVQADSAELADKKGTNEGDGEQLEAPKDASEGEKAEKA
jgi:hypothetical protein